MYKTGFQGPIKSFDTVPPILINQIKYTLVSPCLLKESVRVECSGPQEKIPPSSLTRSPANVGEIFTF